MTKESVSECLKQLIEGDYNRIKREWRKDGKASGAKRIALALFEKMEDGNLNAIREGLDRAEGKPITPVAFEGEVPVVVRYATADDNPEDPT